MEIKLKVRLSAYAKYTLPDLNDYVLEAPKDNIIYARRNGEWIDITDEVIFSQVEVADHSGLEVKLVQDGVIYTYILNTKQENIVESELPEELEDDTIYYVVSQQPSMFVEGGTAWSSGNNEYVDTSEYQIIYNCGGSSTTAIDIILQGTNSKGIYEGEE